MDKIKKIEQSVSVRIAMILSKQLTAIEDRQKQGIEPYNNDIKFLKWYVTASTKTRDEFGKRQEVETNIDPEYEIRCVGRRIDEATSN